MAIGFARAAYVKRSEGKNACCTSAYNSRSKIKDENTGITYDFTKRGGNVYHEMILPEHVDKKYIEPAVLSNEVESKEKRKNSQLYLEYVLALPKEEEVSLEMKVELVHEFIKRKGFKEGGLGIQIDIHEPHDGEMNWHAHLLVTTRRFTMDGKELGEKARDLQPEVKFGKVQKTVDIDNNILWTDVQNDLFKSYGMDLRVDLPGEITQEHIGPVRMRSALNQAMDRNELRRIANIEAISVGADLVDRVSKNSSVFSVSDLRRAVGSQVRDHDEVNALVKDALEDKRLVPLYDEAGKFIDRYTTIEIRKEESKLLRLSEYVAAQKNPILQKGREEDIKNVISEGAKDLSAEQAGVLEHLLTAESGIRVLRGRAGTGKSHVLRKIPLIAEKFGVNVVGVAPTHKAKQELARDGYKSADTIKGMLFKLYNGMFHLPRGSIIVVDEAGMVGNDDYMELQRVAAARNCNLIKAGDERQITPVGRGGMFEVFAEKYSSDVLTDIKRQRHNWGKAVARAFSNGEVQTGLRILHSQNRIVQDKDRVSSMETLLKDWAADENNLKDKIILAVKNDDVNALNAGARQYLKAKGVLTGDEIKVLGRNYMKGDRVLISQTNKDLGLTNGDIGELKEVSEKKFVVSIPVKSMQPDSDGEYKITSKEVTFDPSDYSGFRHGYATTVFKSQAASILSVFVYHGGFAGIRNAYVALSRQIKDLKLYINAESTRSMQHLIQQLSNDPDTASSLSYLTKEDLEKKEVVPQKELEKTFFASLADRAYKFGVKKFTELTDKHIPDWKYYDFKPDIVPSAKVEKVLDSEYLEQEIALQESHAFEATQEKIDILEGAEKIFASDTNIPSRRSARTQNVGKNRVIQTPKEKFYAKADRARGNASADNKSKKSSDPHLFAKEKLSNLVEQREQWDREREHLKAEARFRAEEIARDVLGDPNTKLSNSKTLRFGDNGKIAVRISGSRMGQWYDFSSNKGGDIFGLIQDHRHCDFRGAADYVKSKLGISSSDYDKGNHLRLVENHRSSDRAAKYLKEQEKAEKESKLKLEQVNKLYARSKGVGDKSVAHRYLSEVRNITCDLSKDIKTAGIAQLIPLTSDKVSEKAENKRKYLPALLAFARDKRGNITGGQQILLDKNTGGKADIDIPKKSFGRIAGSFVDVGAINIQQSTISQTVSDQSSPITIIAEGLETALSVKQALANQSLSSNSVLGSSQINILCSLGISNIRNYHPELEEKIIIAADNDGDKNSTSKTIENAVATLIDKGAFVEIAKPEDLGDFNDILCKSGNIKSNEREIAKAFEKPIKTHTASNLSDYFASKGSSSSSKLSSQELSDLKYIQKFGLDEGKIVDAYRKSEFEGSIALEQTRKELDFAQNKAKEFDSVIKDTQELTYKLQNPDHHQKMLLADKNHFIKSILGMDDKHSKDFLVSIRNSILTRHIGENLAKLGKAKAKDPIEATRVLKQEEDLLVLLGDGLKHKDYYSDAALSSIKSASQNKKDNMMNELVKLGKFMHSDQSFVKADEMTKILKSSYNVRDAHDKLLGHYQSRFKEVMVEGIKSTINGKEFGFDGKKWSSPVKFLDHLMKNKNSSYAPHKTIAKAKEKLIDMNKNKSREIGGPEL